MATDMTKQTDVRGEKTLDYEQCDATDLAKLVADGSVSPREMLDEAIRRADAIDPSLNAVVVRSDDVARNKLQGDLPDGPFTGVPFLMKDLGAEAVDYPTNSGSKLFSGTRHSYDSEIYLRMQRSGLVTFGRTASPELGIGPATESQAYGGPTRNPWNLERTPGGSSGGSGAAVAAGIVPVAHGSDGGGSVRIPAASCGLVGLKPTRARLPDGPAVGEGWAGMAIDGFLTRSLRDTAALMDACQGSDLGAPYVAPALTGTFTEAMARDPEALKIVYMTKTFTGDPISPDCRAAVESTATLLDELGHRVEEFSGTIEAEEMMTAWTTTVACGTALSVHAKAPPSTLDESQIEGVTRGALRLAERFSGADYLDAVNKVHAFGRQMARQFLDFDVLLTSTLAEPPARIGRFKPDNEDFLDYRMGPNGVFAYSPYTAAFNASGQPAISLPLHWTQEDLPVGLHFAAAFGNDLLLMSLAGQLERAAPWREKQQEVIDRLAP